MKTDGPLPRQAFAGLPGAELVCAGLAALEALAKDSRETPAARPEFPIEALLVAIGARRLRRAGVRVPDVPGGLPKEPELALYKALSRQHGNGAHSRYNALIRRLVSFERAVEALSIRRAKATPPTGRLSRAATRR